MTIKNIAIMACLFGAALIFFGGETTSTSANPSTNTPIQGEAVGVKEIPSEKTVTPVVAAEDEVKEEQKKPEIPQLNLETDYLFYPANGEMNKRFKPYIDEELNNIEKYWPLIYSCSTEYGLDPYNMVGQIYAESHFWDSVINGSTRSNKGATGIAQFMPSTAAAYGVSESDLKNPEISINLMCKYMSDKLKKYSFEDAVAAYHQGETGLKNQGRGPSELYIQWIKANAELLKKKS